MAGTQVLTVSKEVLSVQMFKHLADYRRTRQVNLPFFDMVMKSAKPWDGSDTILMPLDVDDHSQATQLVTGYEQYDDAVKTTMINGQLYPAWVVQPAMISEIDEKVAGGSGNVIDRAKKNVENVNDHLRRSAQKAWLRGPVSSGAYVAPRGFAGFNTANGIDFATGFYEAAATGANTVHGISRMTYPAAVHPHLNNQYFDAASQAGTNLLNQMYTSFLAIGLIKEQPRAATNAWFMTITAAGHLKRAYRVMEQYVSDGALDDSKRVPVGPGGVPIHVSGDMPVDGALSAASKMSALMVNTGDDFEARFFNGWKFDMTPWENIPGTAGVKAALFKVGGNIATRQAGLSVVIENAEVY